MARPIPSTSRRCAWAGSTTTTWSRPRMPTASWAELAGPGRRAMATAAGDGPLAASCRGVTKVFGAGDSRTVALQGVDADVGAGVMTLLVGPSGCGKTTLISILAGLLEPTAGRVVVLGQDLTAMTDGRKTCFRGDNIGFVFQQYN